MSISPQSGQVRQEGDYYLDFQDILFLPKLSFLHMGHIKFSSCLIDYLDQLISINVCFQRQ